MLLDDNVSRQENKIVAKRSIFNSQCLSPCYPNFFDRNFVET